MKICFATNNKKKLEEVREALKDTEISILSLAEIGCREELPETGDTLTANAIQKARFVYQKFRVNCFADDTGLEALALDGAPGVYTGRFAGEPRSDERNIDLLLEKLSGTDNREARFRTVIALVLEDREYLFEGIAVGKITRERSGDGGFGYDPVFLPNGFSKTFAQLGLDEKNAISHRGEAVRKLVNFLASNQME